MIGSQRKLISTVIALVLGAAVVVVAAAPAGAARAEPAVTSLAWYWEEAAEEEFPNPAGGTTIVETPNPFCPGPGQGLGQPSQTCAEGRLPIEIQQGDYKTPNKIPAVGFDMTLVPIGSEVNKFTVTFREAQSGCYDKDGKPDQDPSDDGCEQTDPFNVGDHQLQACKVTSFFGDGEARPYKEAPKYTCTKADPKAKRKELKVKDGDGSSFYWTFDLTKFAQSWVKSFSVTSIVLTGVPTGENDDDSWRVVLAGPKFQRGVTTDLDYTPGEAPGGFETFAPPGGTTTTTTTGTGTFGTGSTGTGTFGTGSTGAAGTGTTGTGTTGAGEAPSEVPPLATEGAEATQPQGFPGYVWLALLAGLIGFSLFRSVVLESVAGIRPNGVLARIHRINAERQGGLALEQAAEASAANPLWHGLRSIAGSARTGLGKLAFWKKG